MMAKLEKDEVIPFEADHIELMVRDLMELLARWELDDMQKVRIKAACFHVSLLIVALQDPARCYLRLEAAEAPPNPKPPEKKKRENAKRNKAGWQLRR